MTAGNRQLANPTYGRQLQNNVWTGPEHGNQKVQSCASCQNQGYKHKITFASREHPPLIPQLFENFI